MSTKRVIIIAAAAAASVSRALEEDEFPPLASMGLGRKGNTAVCSLRWTGYEFEDADDCASILFSVGSADNLKIENIYCPAYDRYKAFRTYFSFDPNAVQRYHRNLPHPDWEGRNAFRFGKPPPYGAGADPLRVIDKSPYAEELVKLDEVARQIDFTALKGDEDFIGQGRLKDLGEAGKKTVKELENVCNVFKRTLQKKYKNNFVRLCMEARDSSERAIDAATQAGNQFSKYVETSFGSVSPKDWK
ncbi:hypothetical protein FOZ60_007755 [Perkinsus olseni]|uniref:Uncharacterized protein n=1 Tax=Perkinsus olseni TaxID=32597 RepID=A0A7J6NL06_PEROL|nr:hypothetical protein FOZ60_007755 [Perkinsus olseni]